MKASEETLKRELQRKYELKVQEDSIKNIEREKLNESQLALSETKIKDTKNLIIGSLNCCHFTYVVFQCLFILDIKRV